jgi:DNA-binding beta-propeller fold protein YncE
MKKFIPHFIMCFLYFSCTKETKEIVVITPAQSTAYIYVDQVVNDSTIVLKWSKYTGEKFLRYLLVRTATYLKNGQFGTYIEPIDSSNNVDHLNFTENKMPLARDIYYDIYGFKDTIPRFPFPQFTSRVYYQRPKSLVFGIPQDVLISKQQQRLYITEQNRITITDYSGKIITTKDFASNIGFCSLGDFNGVTELYVPLGDGWLQILDPATLELKDKLYVAGYEIGSALAVNGKLYVSSSDRSIGGYSNCIKVYDRGSKTLIGRTGYWDRTRLLLLEGTTVEMVDISINLIPTSLNYFQFSADGIPLVKKEDTYHGDYQMNPGIARSFPDGSKFITSSSGTIFHKSLLFDRYVKQYGNYADFAFNNDGSIIYAANALEKKIDVINYPATTIASSFTTNLYPYKIFRDGNMLICVSKTYTNQQMNYLLIEKVNL